MSEPPNALVPFGSLSTRTVGVRKETAQDAPRFAVGRTKSVSAQARTAFLIYP
jgi:hypothetical protein